MAKQASGRKRLRTAIETATTARRTLDARVENELDTARAWLASLPDELEADGCEIRTLKSNSVGKPLGHVAGGWCAVFPDTCVYLAVWEQGRPRRTPEAAASNQRVAARTRRNAARRPASVIG